MHGLVTRPFAGALRLQARAGLLAGAGLVLGVAALVALVPGPLRARTVACWLALLVLHLALVAGAVRVARAAGPGTAVRRIWSGIAFAGAAFALGDVAQLVLLAARPFSPRLAVGQGVQNVLLLVGLAGLVGTALTEPLRLESRRRRVRYWLDVAIVMGATVPLALAGAAPGPGAGPADVLLAVATGPLLFVVGVFAVVKLLLAEQRPFTRPAGWLLAGAGLLEVLAASRGADPGDGAGLPWLFGLQVLANGLLALSAFAQQAGAGPDGAPTAPRRYSLVPYAAVAVTDTLLVVALVGHGLTTRVWGLVAGAVVCTVLVVVRQLHAFVENDRLLAELDLRVAELNDALAERDRLAGRLQHQAFHDQLTGLPNRAQLLERLEQSVAGGPAAAPVALMVLDLDGFKPVNDDFGHEVGDQLLVAVAERLAGCVRDGDLVARLGGDEFAALVSGGTEPAETVAARMVHRLGQPFVLGSPVPAPVTIGASIGVVAVCPGPDGDRSAEQLLRGADGAMYEAKRAGKGRYRVASWADAGSRPAAGHEVGR